MSHEVFKGPQDSPEDRESSSDSCSPAQQDIDGLESDAPQQPSRDQSTPRSVKIFIPKDGSGIQTSDNIGTKKLRRRPCE